MGRPSVSPSGTRVYGILKTDKKKSRKAVAVPHGLLSRMTLDFSSSTASMPIETCLRANVFIFADTELSRCAMFCVESSSSHDVLVS
jgi:hypothetical protein